MKRDLLGVNKLIKRLFPIISNFNQKAQKVQLERNIAVRKPIKFALS